jgi:hypothetical protein
MATVSYRRNLIAQVQDDYGIFLINHEDKANHLWYSFKNRMGISENVGMEFNMRSLVHNFDGDDLNSLSQPFLVAKIDNIIRLCQLIRPLGLMGLMEFL